jgi:uncharacterized delta-60 repeat protein
MCMTTGSAVAAPGDVDRAFGQEGTAFLPTAGEAGSKILVPNDMAVGPDQTIYVLRTRHPCGSCELERLVTRLGPDGSLDPAFANGGTAGVSGERGLRQSAALAIGPDGKVVVVAADLTGLDLARLNPNGTPDASFGDGGSTFVELGFEVDRLRVAVSENGSIVVAADGGVLYNEPVVAITRFTPLGAPDPTFNHGAPVMTTLGSGLGGFGLGRDGRAVVAGPRCCSFSGSSVHLARIDEDGTFDFSFGRRGQRFLDDVAPRAAVGEVVVLRDRRIDVVGIDKSGRAFALRLLPGGRLDRRFGKGGIAHARTSFVGRAGGVVDGNGRLLIAGTVPNGRSGVGPFTGFGLMRRLRDGRPDRTFGGGGTVGFSAEEEANFLAIDRQSGYRILVLAEVGNCERSCPPRKTAVVRFLGGSSGARCLGRRATIVGTRNADRLIGTPRRDVIAALAGNDVVRGSGGNDLICGGRGNDRLIGGSDKDRFLGGTGRNQVRR